MNGASMLLAVEASDIYTVMNERMLVSESGTVYMKNGGTCGLRKEAACSDIRHGVFDLVLARRCFDATSRCIFCHGDYYI